MQLSFKRIRLPEDFYPLSHLISEHQRTVTVQLRREAEGGGSIRKGYLHGLPLYQPNIVLFGLWE
jgi:hypothetical protein